MRVGAPEMEYLGKVDLGFGGLMFRVNVSGVSTKAFGKPAQ